MAKELPYFKFEPNQWENGNIQMFSHEVKGVFIDLCSMYWSRLGELPFKLAVQKICGGNATALQTLCDENIIEVIEGDICIHFLNEQLLEFENVSNQNRANALAGWEKRRKGKRKNATAKQPQSERNAIREEKRREEEIRKESFESFWNLYDKKTGKEKALKKFLALTDQEVNTILQHVPKYVASTPDKKFRKDPTTYLNGKCFNDEIIKKENTGNQANGNTSTAWNGNNTNFAEGWSI